MSREAAAPVGIRISTDAHGFFHRFLRIGANPWPPELRSALLGSRFKLVTTATETCPICGGTGWHTIERGKEREAVRCECRVKDRGERLLAAAHIPPRYQHCELAN